MRQKTVAAAMLGLATLAGIAGSASAAEQTLSLQWAELMPPVVPKSKALKPFFTRDAGGVNIGSVPDDGTPAPPPADDARWMSSAQKSRNTPPPAVVESLDGKHVHIGGYVVPLDFDATTVKEFLLVPFVGACIHVPPPPANQIIYVKSAKGLSLKGQFDPVYVTGTMKVSFTPTGLADAAYSIDADAVEAQ